MTDEVSFHGLLSLYNSMHYMTSYFQQNVTLMAEFDTALGLTADNDFPANIINMV